LFRPSRIRDRIWRCAELLRRNEDKIQEAFLIY
jgi:hypothetical protein